MNINNLREFRKLPKHERLVEVVSGHGRWLFATNDNRAIGIRTDELVSEPMHDSNSSQATTLTQYFNRRFRKINTQKFMSWLFSGDECTECKGEKEIDCPECNGGGDSECDSCEGSGYCFTTCEECGGDGKIEKECDGCDGDCKVEEDCSECDGDGEVRRNCNECDGSSKITRECSECSGSGEGEAGGSCSKCDGDGEIEEDCEECDCGMVDVDCSDCDGCGKVQSDCTDCDGNGTVEKDCSECDEDGEVETPCSGCDCNGRVDCGDCDGDGYLDCDDCEDFGKIGNIAVLDLSFVKDLGMRMFKEVSVEGDREAVIFRGENMMAIVIPYYDPGKSCRVFKIE